MYFIIDLYQNPPEKVPNISFTDKKDACKWIDESGDECPLCRYTIIEES